MNQNYYEFVCKECEEALLSNEEYVELEKEEADVSEILGVVEVTCYQRGFDNAVKMLTNKL